MTKIYTDIPYWKDIVSAGLCKLLILRALANEPLHGYALIRRIGEQTGEFYHPSEGTVYPILREFTQSGYVSVRTTVVHGRERKEYTLTSKGSEALKTGNAVWRRGIKCLQNK